MARRSYGQYCGFARALEVVGERWSFLIVRDLLVAAKRFTDLHRGLPGIPTNVLATRLKELEEADVVRRRAQPRPERGVVYELTAYGRELDEVVRSLGHWGAKALDDPRVGEVITPDSMISAFRTTFRPSVAAGVRCTYELRFGEIVLHARIDDGELDVAVGPLPDADLTITAGPGIKHLLTGAVSPQEAIASGLVSIDGKIAFLERFARLFRIDAKPGQGIVSA